MIVILGYLKIDTEVSDIGMESVESNDYRRVSEDDRDANGMLAMI